MTGLIREALALAVLIAAVTVVCAWAAVIGGGA